MPISSKLDILKKCSEEEHISLDLVLNIFDEERSRIDNEYYQTRQENLRKIIEQYADSRKDNDGK